MPQQPVGQHRSGERKYLTSYKKISFLNFLYINQIKIYKRKFRKYQLKEKLNFQLIYIL